MQSSAENKETKERITKYDLWNETRITKAETVLSNIEKELGEVKNDLRWLLGMMISFNCSLMALMAKGFHWF